MIDDNLIFNTLTKDTCEVYQVKDRHKPNWNCVVPKYCNDKIVTRISDFFCYHTLKSITLPDSIESISYEAFDDCDNLSEINIPESIKAKCLYYFSSLKKLTINNNYLKKS